MRVLGFDPSMSNWGWVLADIVDGNITPLMSGVICVSADPTISKSNPVQNIYRASAILRELIAVLDDVAGVYDIYVEVPHGGKSSQAAVSATMCQTLLGSLLLCGVNIIPVTAMANKKTVGNKTASKDDVIDWINQRHPEFLPKKKDGSILKNKAEHIADALLTIYTGLNK